MKRKLEDTGSKLDRKLSRVRAEFKLKPHQSRDRSSSKLDSLPLDLKLEILNRLPAKSVTKFRFVSKMWSSIILNREISRTFFSISSNRPRMIVALSNGIYNDVETKLVFFFSFDQGEEGDSSSSLIPSFDMAVPSVALTDSTGACKSVHGFLTIQSEFHLPICNPCTQQFFDLPNNTAHVGYDPIHDQHKALSIVLTGPHDDPVLKHRVKTFGQGGGWRLIKSPTPKPYTPLSVGVSINGFLYYAAHSPMCPTNPGIVCFDVCSEKLTYIKVPPDVLSLYRDASFIEYKGKLASVVGNPFNRFDRFHLYILQDITKNIWSRTTCVVPPSVWDSFGGILRVSFPGTNKAGEIIMAPTVLSRNAQPFYIFYFNVETKNVRRVRLHGIGDSQEFRRSYGFVDMSQCHVRIAPQHIESIVFFKNQTTSFQRS